MASPREIAPLLPETLPEDFKDWDSEASTAPSPVKPGEREAWEATHSFDGAAEPLWQSADREAFLASLVDGPRVSGSASPAPLFVKQQKDFIDWNSEAPATPWPANRTAREARDAAPSSAKTAKPLGYSADREALLSPVLDRPRESSAASSAPVVVKPQELTNELVDGSPSRASHGLEASHAKNEVPVAPGLPNLATVDGVRNSPASTVKTRREAEEAIYQLFSPENIKVKTEQKTTKKKWVVVASVSAGSLLLPLIFIIPMLHHETKSVTKPSLQPVPVETYTEPNTSTPKPSAKKPLTQEKLPATSETQPATDDPPANQEPGVTPAPVPTSMMNDQLTAPTRIPKQAAENTPPPANFGAAGADGLGGSANGSMFNERGQPAVRVTSSKPIAISSGVATGMLIKSTPPIYPTIAKTAGVSGTVELHATITAYGTIKDIQAVSGPAMLRQAAIDAVRTWRYKPYMLNNAPIEVETTIHVVFTLAR